MRRWLLIAAFVVVAVLLAAGVVGYFLYRASQRVPEFYQEALQAVPKAQEEASDEMVRQVTALVSDAQKKGAWEAVFTAQQINGWLAVDMPRNHADLLPSSASDPRVTIEPDEIRIACRVNRGNWTGVVSVAVDLYLAEPNVVAARIRDARIGSLPLPLKDILERISQEAAQTDLKTRWRQADGDPVVEVFLPQPRGKDDKRVRIETLQLGEGSVYVSGSTERN